MVALLLAGDPAFGDDESTLLKESQIKAAFLYNFTKFVEWPAGTFRGAGAPIVIGVLGESSMVDELEAIVAERHVNGRAIEIRSVQGATATAGVQLLFVTAEASDEFLALSGAMRGEPVLTIGESPDFAAGTGIIGFVQLGSKVRFEIDMVAAGRARLKVSGQLQKLATSIRR
jgi:hypothetical protein